MTSPSTLTRAQFEQASKALIAKYAHLTCNTTALKGWSWEEPFEERGDGCLFRTALIRVHARNSDSDLLEDGIPEPEEVIDDPAIAHDTSSNYLTCSQSVTFSPTYQVPAFHFSIHHPGGRPLWLDEIMNTSLLRHHALPETQVTDYQLVQPNAPFPLLSQTDHPTLCLPVWYVHPCGTGCAMGELIGEKIAEAMPGLVDDDKWLTWLETWFMMMGNIVEL